MFLKESPTNGYPLLCLGRRVSVPRCPLQLVIENFNAIGAILLVWLFTVCGLKHRVLHPSVTIREIVVMMINCHHQWFAASIVWCPTKIWCKPNGKNTVRVTSKGLWIISLQSKISSFDWIFRISVRWVNQRLVRSKVLFFNWMLLNYSPRQLMFEWTLKVNWTKSLFAMTFNIVLSVVLVVNPFRRDWEYHWSLKNEKKKKKKKTKVQWRLFKKCTATFEIVQ